MTEKENAQFDQQDLPPTEKILDPDEVLQVLKDGNLRFSSGNSTYPRLYADRIQHAAVGDQADHAYATVIACSDSRVPVELLFDAEIMDLFVIRVAGNVAAANEIGSIEYGLAYVRTPVLLVLGHTQCGAVEACVHAVHDESQRLEQNIQSLVDQITPAVQRAMDSHQGVDREAIIPYVIEENVWLTIEKLFTASSVARGMVNEGKVKVIGAIYDLGTGTVRWLPSEKVDDILKRVEGSL